MIPSKNNSNPFWSFGHDKKLQPPKILKTDFIYNPSSENKYKFTKSPQWKFAKSPQRELKKPKYLYYSREYNKQTDKENLKLKWKKVIGGDIGCENRYKNVFESSPGPGKYNPSIRYARYHNGGAGYLGIKLNDDLRMNKGCTNSGVGPQSYEIGERSRYVKFAHSPKFSFGNDKRKGLHKKIDTKTETYCLYSSVGEQILGEKLSEPQFSFGKEERFKQKRF